MKNFKTIKDIIWKYRWRYFWGIAFLLLVDTLQLFIPILTGDLSDALYAGTASRETVIKTALGIIGLGLGIGGFRFCWRYFIIGTAMRVEYDLKNRLYGHLLHLSQNYYNEHKTGDLMAHLTNDLNAVRMCMGQGVMQVADALYLTTSTVIILMGKVDVKLTLLAILPLPFVTLTIITLGRVIHRRFARVQETFSNLSDTVQENFSGLKVIKSFVQEDAEIKKFEAKALDCYDAHLSLTKLRAFFFSMLAFITGLTYVIVIGLGGKMVVDGSITVGNFVTFIGYLGTLSWPVRALGFVINQVQRGSASMGRINKILAAKAEIREDDDPVSSDLSGDIVFQGVSYSYPNTELKALDNINLTVPAGTSLGIIGRTGSGKTTFISTLPRLFDPTAGRITIGGVDIRHISLRDLRENIGFVPQDSFLFSATIADNIGFSFDHNNYEMDDIVWAAQTADIHENIMGFPEGYETFVGERGVTLSGGQKQRVSMARALIKKPRILIFDDSLSAVDTETEETILQNLKGVMKDRTSIVISHRISSVKDLDHIIVLENGSILEEGTHEELLAARGSYYELYQHQTDENNRAGYLAEMEEGVFLG